MIRRLRKAKCKSVRRVYTAGSGSHLAPALDALHLAVRVDPRMPFHPVLVRAAERIPAAAGSEYLVGAAAGRRRGLVPRQSRRVAGDAPRARGAGRRRRALLAARLLARPDRELLVAVQRRALHPRTLHLQRDRLRDKQWDR